MDGFGTGLALGLLVGALVAGVLAWSAASRRAESRVRRAQVDAARAEALLSAARERQVEAGADAERMSDQFRSLAAEALATSTDQFLALASQRFAADHQTQVGELAQREQAVRAMVEPLARTLEQVRTELTTAERARLEGQSALGEQVRAMRAASDQLRGETAQLVTALRSSQVRGRWGELQLRRVVEAAGMLAHVDFTEQSQVRTDDGLLRPDMVVRLAGGKQVVVDAKVAFIGFLEASTTSDEAVRTERLAAHARHMRKHIDDLAAKKYWNQFEPAPEFVVMFVPAESFLHAAVEQDPAIIEYAFERDVVLATPVTLLALLRTIAYAWRQDALAANAQAVLTLGKELHGRLATMGGHLARLGRAIDGAADAYNKTVSSLETRVLVSARRFAELGVVDGDLPAPAPADPRLATLGAPELVASEQEQIVELDGRALREERAWAREQSLADEVRRAAEPG
ncbi:MAG TPA: DNA recombination protein RmuC [Cellulomonas sp.]|nr:DNA recombination protein RmuC [Cellulomonas sp.]